MADRELEEFKSRIDLRAYAAQLGYELDRRESSRSSSIMRRAGDKVVIKRDSDNHYVYFSVHDDADSGTIIDFAQRRKHLNLGQLRKELRPWIGQAALPLPLFVDLFPSSKDRTRVERSYALMAVPGRYAYLEDERKIPPALLGSPRFAGRVRIDDHGAAVFPHFDGDGLCGYEIKNRGFTGFAAGGEKGLWESHDLADDTAIVFTESAIDALSHAVLFPAPLTRYRSVGGTPNPKQPELIKAAITAMPKLAPVKDGGAVVICATDNDEDGRKLAGMIEECFKTTGRIDLTFKHHLPEPEGADWNEILKSKSSPALRGPFPTARCLPR